MARVCPTRLEGHMATGFPAEVLLTWAVDVDESGVVVARPRGEVTRETVDDLRAHLRALDGHGAPSVMLDLSEITFIDSAGFDALAEFGRSERQNGHHVMLCTPSIAVQRMLDVLGVPQGFVVGDGAPK